jgi:hypothetical protein
MLYVHSDLMLKGPSDREGQTETKKWSRNQKPVPRPIRVDVADTNTDTDLCTYPYGIIIPFIQFLALE